MRRQCQFTVKRPKKGRFNCCGISNSTGFYVTAPAADKAYRVLIKPTDGVTHSA